MFTMKTKTPRGSFADTIEAWLRVNSIPYVAVDEAKKALFTGATLKSFDFVAYRPRGQNSLIHCGERTAENLADLRQWADIFGEGFRPVFAVKRKGGWELRDLDGQPVERASLLPDGQADAAPVTLPIAPPKPPRKPTLAPPAPPPAAAVEVRGPSGPGNREPEFAPTVVTPGVQGSLIGERYEGSSIGSLTPGMFGDMRPDPAPRVEVDTNTLCLF